MEVPNNTIISSDESNLSAHPQFEENATKNGSPETMCKWVGCSWPQQPTQAALVSHIAERHLRFFLMDGEHAKAIACHWSGCADYGIPKFTKTALTNHLRIHTGEKRFFCPVPECSKFFGKQDVLTRHIKAAHDLHATKDGLVLHRERIKRFKYDIPEIEDGDEESANVNTIELDDELRTPWWYTLQFIDLIRDKNAHSQWNELLDLPINDKEYRVALERYRLQVGPDPTTEETDYASDIAQLEKTSEVLESRLNVANKVSSVLQRELLEYNQEKRKLWLTNQILIDANVKLGLPGLSSSATSDPHDDFLLESTSS